MELFLHDAEIVAYSVDLEKSEIRFKVHDVWEKQVGEVIFHDVIAHQFHDFWPQNVIFDIDKYSWDEAIAAYKSETFRILEIFFYQAEENFSKIDAIAREKNISGFSLGSSNGMHGIIFASKMEKRVLDEKYPRE